MINVFHSFWTKPGGGFRNGIPVKDNFYAQLLCAANSVLLAKRNGCKINLYTDNDGIKAFGILPYDNISTDLEDLDVNTAFWAAGKIKAHHVAPIGHIQIDIDVYLKGKMCVDLLEYALKYYDLVVQNRDCEYSNSQYYAGVVNEARRILPNGVPAVPHFDINGLVYAYSCGLVGFNSQELKDLYCAGYDEITEAFENSPLFATRDKNFCLDLIAEQAYLKMCQNALGSPDFSVIGDNWGLEQKSFCDKIGYTHLTYTSKFSEKIIARNEDILKTLSLEIWRKVSEYKK